MSQPRYFELTRDGDFFVVLRGGEVVRSFDSFKAAAGFARLMAKKLNKPAKPAQPASDDYQKVVDWLRS